MSLPSYYDCYERPLPPHPGEGARPEPCPECGGDGGFSYPISMCHIDGSIKEGWDECRCCGGSGEIDIELTPITLEDLEVIELELEGMESEP